MPNKKQSKGKGDVTPQRKSPRNHEKDVSSPMQPNKNPAVSVSPCYQAELDILPPQIKQMELCRPLRDLALAIHKVDKGKLMKNKEVIENFKDAQQIFLAWQTPQKSLENGAKSKKRKRSGILQNGEEGTKGTEETRKKLELEVEENNKLPKDLNSYDTEQKLRDELDKCKSDLEREGKAHQNTKKQEQIIKAELLQTSFKNDMLQKQLTTLEAELQENTTQIQSKNEKLEALSNELIARSEYIEKKSLEIKTLQEECNRLKSDLGTKKEEIDDLRNRFSSLSASKLDNDPNITDLGDPNRPLNLATKYQHLYDELWTDAFDELTESYTDINTTSEKEKRAASEMLVVFKIVLSFCEAKINDQEKTIVSILMCCSKDDVDIKNCCIDINSIKETRKANIKTLLPALIKSYIEQSNYKLNSCLEDFAKGCVEICWLSLIQDPPMVFEFDYVHGSSFDKDLMRDFTAAGDRVDFVVWPTLRLHKDGPVMSKSVVQPLKNRV